MQLRVSQQELDKSKADDENLLQSDRPQNGLMEDHHNLLDEPDEIQESLGAESPNAAKPKLSVGNFDDNIADEEEESKVHTAQFATAGKSNLYKYLNKNQASPITNH